MTTQELYNAIICKSDLHSIPQIHDNILLWPLYKNAYVQAFCNDGDTAIDIVSNSVFSGSMIHWHPDQADMIDELYNLGKKGNMLVLKSHCLEQAFSIRGKQTVSPSTTSPRSISARKSGVAASWSI